MAQLSDQEERPRQPAWCPLAEAKMLLLVQVAPPVHGKLRRWLPFINMMYQGPTKMHPSVDSPAPARLHFEKATASKVSNHLSSDNISFQEMLAVVTAIYLQSARVYSNTPGFLPRVGLEVFCSTVIWTSAFPSAFIHWVPPSFPLPAEAPSGLMVCVNPV